MKNALVAKFSAIVRCSQNSSPSPPSIPSLNCSGVEIKVDLLDTAGKLEFPAMERLYIATGDGFVLVFDITEPASLKRIVEIMRQIVEQRGLKKG